MALSATLESHAGSPYPSDWEVLPLSALCRSIIDGTHFTPKYVPRGIPFYSVENVTADEFEATKFITSEEHAKLVKRCRPEKGDILMTRIGSLGATKLLTWDVDASIYVSLALLKPNGRIDVNYLYWYSQSGTFVEDVRKRALVNAIPQKINVQDIGNVPVRFPPSVLEQEAIAEALSDADAAVAALDALIAKKQDVKQAAMHQLLTGRTRLPGFDDEWSRRRLGDFCRIVMGQSPVSEFYNTAGDGLPLIQGNADIKNRQTIARVWSSHAPKVAGTGDVLLTVRAPVGAAARASAPVCLGRGVCALQPSGITEDFLFHALVFGEPRWAALEQGSTFTAANARDVAEFSVDVPASISEQEAISAVLSDMDAEVEALVAEREKLRLVKQGMMQELLSGRVRLV